MCHQQNDTRVWIKDRFPASGPIIEATARSNLPTSVSDIMVQNMVIKIHLEREEVKLIIKAEVEKLMRMGTGITGMTFQCQSMEIQRPCITPRNMRTSFCQNGSASNIRIMHWIFHRLPWTLYQDITMNRQTHCDLVVATVMKRMNVTWGPKREGETTAHTNCIVHMYSRMINEKKQTIVKKGDGNTHNRMPFVRNPKLLKGKTVFHWNHTEEGLHKVSKM
jgi:hypothetical protein